MDQQLFAQYVAGYAPLSNADKKLIDAHTDIQTFKPGEYFLRVGQVSHQVGYIITGVFRFFFYDGDGAEITSVFFKPHQPMTCINSFFEYQPCSGGIQSETHAKIVLISREAWELFAKQIPHWNSAFEKIKNDSFLEKATFQRFMLNADAKTRYRAFAEQHPEVMGQAALGHIASYLGVTQYSLSRIRKQIAEEDDFLPNGKKP